MFMNKKRLNFLVSLVLVSILVLLTACAGTDSSTMDSSDSNQTQQNVEDSVDNSSSQSDYEYREIVVTTIGTTHPYSFVDESNDEWTGVDGEIWTEIGNRTGWDIEVLRGGSFDASIGNLASGRAHVASNHYAPTPERLEQYDTTKPYSTDIGTIAIRPEDEGQFVNISDFEGKTVGVTSGSSNELRIRELAEEIGFDVATYDETDPAMQDLSNGNIDGFVGSVTLFGDYMSKTGREYATIEENFDEQLVVFLLAKNDQTAELQEDLNNLIDEMIEDGTIGSITEKYFGEDMTQYIDSALVFFEENFGVNLEEGTEVE